MSSPLGGIWAPAAMRLVRSAALKASKLVRTRLGDAVRPANVALEPVLVRSGPRQPIHPAALLRQQKSRRWYSTSTYRNIDHAVRRFMSTGRLEGSMPRLDRSKFLGTKTGRAVSSFSGRAPFANALRPNLTGGALPRTAGGYGLGAGRMGGARYFSHGPAAPAEVVQNVSAAVRAFWISGQKAQFDGLNSRGEQRFRAVSSHQDAATRKMAALPTTAPGSYVDFRINPTVTALGPLMAASAASPAGAKISIVDNTTLNTEGFLDVLSGDFARALKDLTATLSDIQKLSSLGDLPVQLEKGHIVRVRFPGVDGDTVERLVEDLGLTRGVVYEDSDFDRHSGANVALKFPFAPDATPADTMTKTMTSPFESSESLSSFPLEEELFADFSEVEENPWLQPLEESDGYESMSPPISSGDHCSSASEGLEGIYRFLEECDRAQGRF